MAPKQRNAQAITSYDVVELKPEISEGEQAAHSLGLVWRTADDSDNSMDDEDLSDDEYFYDDEESGLQRPLGENHAEVVWIADEASRRVGTDIKRTEKDMSNLKVVDRCLQQGDIVACSSDPLGQTGVILDVARDVDVILSTGQVLERQSSDNLQPEIVYQPRQYVLHKDGWFGRINLVYLKFTIAFESGALVELTDMDHYERRLLKPITTDGSLAPTVSEASDFYPGQHVYGDPHLRGFPGTKVLKGTLHYVGHSHSSLRGIVVKTEAHRLKITWLNSLAGGNLDQAPKEPAQPSACTPITDLYFCPAYWHLGTISLWRPGGSDAQQPAAQPEPSQVKSAEGAKRVQSSRQGRTKGPSKHGSAASASDRALPRGLVPETAGPLASPKLQQLCLQDVPPPYSSTEAAAASGPAGGFGSNVPVAAGMVSQEPPTVGSVSAEPERDHLQAKTDDIVAECINNILDEVTPEEVAAQTPGQDPEAQGSAQDQEDEAEEVAETGWSSMGRRGMDAATVLMNCMSMIGVGGSVSRAVAPTPDVPVAHNARRARPGGKKRGRGGRRAGAAQAPLQLKDLPVTAQVLRTYTRATVQWQDGTVSKDVESALLLPVKHTDEHDFYPNSFVADKTDLPEFDGLSEEEKAQSRKLRVGLVKSVDHSQRTATVTWYPSNRWKVPGMTCTNPGQLAAQEMVQAKLVELGEPFSKQEPTYEEVVSVYSIEPQYEFDDMGVGNVVARMDFRAAAAEGRLPGSVGSILRLDGFSMLVAWLDGSQSTVPVEEIFVIGTEEDLEYGDDDNDEGSGSDSEFDLLHGASDEGYTTEEGGEDERDETSMGSEGNAAFRDTVLHVHGSIRREAENMNDAWRAASVSDIDGSSPRTVGEGAVYEEEEIALSASDAPLPTDGTAPESTLLAQAPSEPLQSSAVQHNASASAEDYGFPHFEATEEDPTGFQDMPIDPASTRPSRGFQRAVLAEWKMLRDGLPPTIWVRAFESRMDVMRAAILGAAGTPYHDQLFFFDIQLSPDHPASVPKVLFHAHGNRINPNLYADGKVCLSLLNTWNGRRTEQWDPTSSTILQVLVSIQGLILVAEPYYNEAGYEKQVGTPEGARNSVGYNESAFLATIRTTLSLMRSPPAPFLPLMLAALKNRGPHLLAACKAYLAGTAKIGAYQDSGTSTEGQQPQEEEEEGVNQTGQTTQGFQLVFKGVLPRLEKAVTAV